MLPLFDKKCGFMILKENQGMFYDVQVDTGGYGVVWDDELDLSCNELWERGVIKKT